MITKLTSFILLLVIILGCSSSRHIRQGDSLEVAFEKANNFYERGRFTDAARSFETVLSIGRGTEIAQESQYLLAMSYFNNREYLIAASEFQRYATNFPRSDRRIDAEFKQAMSYYRLSPRYKLDQSDTYRAIELMQLFIGRYPNTEQAQEAANLIDEMRNKLAQKEYSAGQMYLRIRQYQAAAIYFGLVLDMFPETKWAERALASQIDAYIQFAENSVPERQAERFQMAINSYETYIQLFPRGENRSVVEERVDRARQGLAQARRTPVNE
ncbi:MAG: outer membrane protein assembly factor BamD [Balneolales bacterium]|nr:outer membrane protein assembly factor BamD [Balneolales bacterium]